MRMLLIALLAWPTLAAGQIPDKGDFRYQVFDSNDKAVGTYAFTITKKDDLWQITSDMNLDTRVYFLKVRLHDQNTFTHDGQDFRSFAVTFFKDVPFQSTVNVQVEGKREGEQWRIKNQEGEQIIRDRFDEVRNLISRLVRPEAVLRPGEFRRTRSLDPLTLKIGTVESRGVREEDVVFQGQTRRLFVMEQKADDGDVVVKKFANGLIYRSETSMGYALLQSAEASGF